MIIKFNNASGMTNSAHYLYFTQRQDKEKKIALAKLLHLCKMLDL